MKAKQTLLQNMNKFEDLKDGDSITCKEWDKMQQFLPTGYGYCITKRTVPQSTIIFERYLPVPKCKNKLPKLNVKHPLAYYTKKNNYICKNENRKLQF